MQHWIKKASHRSFVGFRSILQKTFLLPNGNTAIYDIVEEGEWVAIAALTTEGQFIVIQQYHPAPEAFQWSFAAGYVEKGEDVAAAARRELAEETGYVAESLHYLKTIQPTYNTAKEHWFFAKNCRRRGDQKLDENEFVNQKLWTRQELTQVLTDAQHNTFTSVGIAAFVLQFCK